MQTSPNNDYQVRGEVLVVLFPIVLSRSRCLHLPRVTLTSIPCNKLFAFSHLSSFPSHPNSLVLSHQSSRSLNTLPVNEVTLVYQPRSLESLLHSKQQFSTIIHDEALHFHHCGFGCHRLRPRGHFVSPLSSSTPLQSFF